MLFKSSTVEQSGHLVKNLKFASKKLGIETKAHYYKLTKNTVRRIFKHYNKRQKQSTVYRYTVFIPFESGLVSL